MGLFNNFKKEEKIEEKEEQVVDTRSETEKLIEEREKRKVLIIKAENLFTVINPDTGEEVRVMGKVTDEEVERYYSEQIGEIPNGKPFERLTVQEKNALAKKLGDQKAYEELFDVILGISIACRIDDIFLSADFPISFEKSGVEPLIYKFIEPHIQVLTASYKNREKRYAIALAQVLKTLKSGYRILLTKEAISAFKDILFSQPDVDNQKFLDTLNHDKQADLSYVFKRPKMQDVRYRVNIAQKYSDEGISYFIVMRFVKEVQTLEELGLPDFFKDLALSKSGLVIWASPTGSGKSTTMAAVVDFARKARPIHIITLEDPIEFVHKTDMVQFGVPSIINQREVGVNVNTFAGGIKAAMREKPHIILVGEIRDSESMQAAFEAALTGHLVLTTIHASDTMEAIDRIINFFPEAVRDSARNDLSKTLTAIIAQRLVKTTDGKRTLALEVLKNIPAVANSIKMNSKGELLTQMATGHKRGLFTLDYSLTELVKEGKISLKEALINAKDQNAIKKAFNITDEEARRIIEGATLAEIREAQNQKEKKKGLFG